VLADRVRAGDVPERAQSAAHACIDCFSFGTGVVLSVRPSAVASDHSTFWPGARPQ
jgi:hypothetical protein